MNIETLRIPEESRTLSEILSVSCFSEVMNVFNQTYSDVAEFSALSGRHFPVTHQTFPRVYAIYRQAMERLGVSSECMVFAEESYDIEYRIVGSDDECAIIISSGCIQALTDEELLAVFGYEIGHIELRHINYQNIFRSLDGILGILPNIASAAADLLKYLSLEWMQYSEISADRAAAAAAGSVKAVEDLLLKRMGADKLTTDFDLIKEDICRDPPGDIGELGVIGKIFYENLYKNTPVPMGVLRVSRLNEWGKSGECKETLPHIYYRSLAGRITEATSFEAGSKTEVVFFEAGSKTGAITFEAGSKTEVVSFEAGSMTEATTSEAGSKTEVVPSKAGSMTEATTSGAGSKTKVVSFEAGSMTEATTSGAGSKTKVVSFEAGRKLLDSNPEFAMVIIHRAAEEGDTNARLFLGKGYFDGRSPLPKEQSIGLEYLFRAAVGGSADAQYLLGRLSLRGVKNVLQKSDYFGWRLIRAAAGNGSKAALDYMNASGVARPAMSDRFMRSCIGGFRKTHGGSKIVFSEEENTDAWKRRLMIPADDTVLACEEFRDFETVIAVCKYGVYVSNPGSIPLQITWDAVLGKPDSFVICKDRATGVLTLESDKRILLRIDGNRAVNSILTLVLYIKRMMQQT